MNYEEMSDFEINMHVAKRVFAESIVDYEVNPFPDGCSMFSFETGKSFSYFDGCNNPSDAWPIIVANKIWVQPDMIGDGFWHCYDCESEFSSKHKNPLRAAMIVFLMMQEQAQ